MSERAMYEGGHDQTLIQRARRGDGDARQTLWVENRRWVAAIILAHRPRSVEVDDLMQEVAVKFISKLDTLRDVGSFKPWLRQIAINSCRGAARRERPTLRIASGERVESGEVAQPDAPKQSGARELEHRDAAERVFEQVMTLPPEYREPLLMRAVQEMSYQQIGEILELPVTTVETRLARARRMLREEMGDEMLDEGVGEE